MFFVPIPNFGAVARVTASGHFGPAIALVVILLWGPVIWIRPPVAIEWLLLGCPAWALPCLIIALLAIAPMIAIAVAWTLGVPI